jgi:nitronate monooxygenase
MPTRRDTLRMAGFAGLAQGALPARAADGGARLRTPVCTLLGIEHPILQAPMQFVATPALVAAVCEAGGFGILPGIGLPPDQLRANIQEVRRLTRRPFGVNLILHSALRPPVDMTTFPAETARSIASVLNRFRERLGLPPRHDAPPTLPDVLPALFEVIVGEKVPVFSTGVGLPSAEMVTRCHQAGMKVMTMVATVADAVEAERLGADLIAAQGSEAGGHRSVGVKPASSERAAIGGVALVPQVVRKVRVPVVAAGAIMDGRGLAAALALGAAGVLMGTRFIATVESGAPPFYKDALQAGDSDDTTLSDAFTGHYARFLRNTYLEDYRSSGAPVFPTAVQQLAVRDIVDAAAKKADPSWFPMYAGQGVGAIDHIPAAADVVRTSVAEACGVLKGLTSLVAP